MLAISVAELSLRLKQGQALRLLDVRRAQALAAFGVAGGQAGAGDVTGLAG